METKQSLLNELNVDPSLINRAFITGHGESKPISDFINQALKNYINNSMLEARGYKETLFILSKNQEIKKLFVKSIAKHEIKHDYPYDHVNNPNFSGVVYPSTFIEVFVTSKSNILVQKAINREVHFCNGQIIQEQDLFRTTDFIICPSLESVRKNVPEPLFKLISESYTQHIMTRTTLDLDDDFYQELEL
ncbi:hypothetical protein PaeBR_02075 [Paenibacillus sp. BR2-3]|uniref:hypothetical protein n=1 Tax=Paenibacillus sp. BR2-3 TaxID=3048494 RepID=UPI0039773625